MTRAPAAMRSMGAWPSPSLIEQTGAGPLVQVPCWLLRWRLTSDQKAEVERLLRSTLVDETLARLCPASIRASLHQAVQHSLPPCVDAAGMELPLALRVVVAMADVCAPSLKLKPVPLNQPSQPPMEVALRSPRHPLAGQLLSLMMHLVWQIISANQVVPQDDQSGAWRRGFAQWSRIDQHLNADTFLSALLEQCDREQISTYLLSSQPELIWQLGMGHTGRLVWHSTNDRDSFFGINFAKNKKLSRVLLQQLGCPVPAELAVSAQISERDLKRCAERLGFPCVIKPETCDRGAGVTAGIQTLEALQLAIAKARQVTQGTLLMQRHIQGDDYRFNVLNGDLRSVVKREVPHLMGNGTDSVATLLKQDNQRRAALSRRDGMTKLVDGGDPDVQNHLQAAGYNWGDVPVAGARINLRSNANLQTGGVRTELDVSTVHAVLRRQCRAIAMSFRLDVCGLDYITTDVSIDPLVCPGAFIEVNAIPEIPAQRAGEFLDHLFPDRCDVIPVEVWVVEHPLHRSMLDQRHFDAIAAAGPNLVLAVHHQWLSEVAAIVPSDVRSVLQGFRHVSEPLLNRSTASLIYLLTPEHVLRHGLPCRTIQGLRVFGTSDNLQMVRHVFASLMEGKP